ncbi:MAG TPA: DUF3592 domain-containing protein [Patescibacteria group bacterium]|nr:DUF3592 domain-containing protein [Patescibacteria group bacterium]
MGVLGVLLLIIGIILITYSLIQAEQHKIRDNGITTTAAVISISEDTCSRGRWSSICYDISIMFDTGEGKTIMTVLEDEFDRPTTDEIPIIYDENQPEQVLLDSGITRPWLDNMSQFAYPVTLIGLALFVGTLFYGAKHN